MKQLIETKKRKERREKNKITLSTGQKDLVVYLKHLLTTIDGSCNI